MRMISSIPPQNRGMHLRPPSKAPVEEKEKSRLLPSSIRFFHCIHMLPSIGPLWQSDWPKFHKYIIMRIKSNFDGIRLKVHHNSSRGQAFLANYRKWGLYSTCQHIVFHSFLICPQDSFSLRRNQSIDSVNLPPTYRHRRPWTEVDIRARHVEETDRTIILYQTPPCLI